MSLRLQYYSHEELGVFSLTEDIPFSHAGYFFFSHREHGGHGGFKRTVSSSQNAFGIQISQNVIAKGGCKVL